MKKFIVMCAMTLSLVACDKDKSAEVVADVVNDDAVELSGDATEVDTPANVTPTETPDASNVAD